MIVTEKKDRDNLFECVKGYEKFFLIGCSECAELCGTGGDKELDELKQYLEGKGKTVTGVFKAKTNCQVLGTKVELKPYKDQINSADCIISMSCGAGAQATVEVAPDKPVYPSNDSLFLGNMTRYQMFDERCSLCGECILDKTGGICPLTNCPKGLLNGPCGGTKDGCCEVSPEIKCCWVRIYERMKTLNKLDEMEDTTLEAKDWSKAQKPRALTAREEKKK